MKRLLIALLAMIAPAVFGQDYPNGVTQMGDPYAGRIYLGDDPIVLINEGSRTQDVMLTYESVLPGTVNLNWTAFTNLDVAITNSYVEYGVFRAPHGTRVPNTQTDNEGVASFYAPAQLSTNIPPWEWVSTTGPGYGGGLLTNTFQLTDVNASTQTDYWIYPIVQVGTTTNAVTGTYPMSSNYNVICIGCQTAVPGKASWVTTVQCDLGDASIAGTAIDGSGNVTVAGFWNGTMHLGSSNVDSAPYSTSYNIFIAKLSPSGSLLWYKRSSSTNGLVYLSALTTFPVRAMTTDAAGNIYITGTFNQTVDFSGVGAANATIVAGSGFAMFVAKYQPDGTFTWAKKFGGVYSDFGSSIALDSETNVIVLGQFTSVGANYGGGYTLSAIGSQDMSLVKLSSATGDTLWATNAGSPGAYNNSTSITVDASNNIVLCRNIVAGASSIGYLEQRSITNGSLIWQRAVSAAINSVAINRATGNIIAAGGFQGSKDFGGGPISTLSDGGIFIASYSQTNGYLWAIASGGNGDAAYDAIIDNSGHLVVSGRGAYGQYFSPLPSSVYGSGQYSATTACFLLSGNAAPVCQWLKMPDQYPISIAASTAKFNAFDSKNGLIHSGSTFGLDRTVFDGILVNNSSGGHSAAFIVKRFLQ